MNYDEFQTLHVTVDGIGQVQQVTKALDAEAAAAGRAQAASRALSRAKAEMARDALHASHALQDLAQSGFGAVLNNVPLLAEGIGRHVPKLAAMFSGPQGLAAAAMVAGVAIYTLKDPFMGLIDWASSGSETIPKTTDALARFQAESKTTKEALDKLKEGWKGTLGELAEYNRLTAEAVRLEKEANAERERRNGLEKARADEAAKNRSPEGAAASTAAMDRMGGVDDTIGAVRNKLNESPEIKAAREAVNAAMDVAQQYRRAGAAIGDQAKADAAVTEAERRRDALTRRNEDRATDLAIRARGGDMAANEELNRMLPGAGFGQATAAGIAARKEADARAVAANERYDRTEETRRRQQELDEARETDEFIGNTVPSPEWYANRDRRRKAQAAVKRAFAPMEAAETREAFDRQQEDEERFFGGGFSGAETETVAQGNLVLARGDRGQARPADVDRAIADAENALHEQVEGGFDPRVMGVLSQLTAELRQLKGRLSQQAQMQRGAMGGPMMGQFSPAPVYQSPFGF